MSISFLSGKRRIRRRIVFMLLLITTVSILFSGCEKVLINEDTDSIAASSDEFHVVTPPAEVVRQMLGEGENQDEYEAGKQFFSDVPVTYSMMYCNDPLFSMRDDWRLWKQIKKETNVSFNIKAVDESDFDEACNMAVIGGNMPLIISHINPGEEKQYISSGRLLAVSDYIEYFPNFLAKIQEWNMDSDLDQIRQDDGKYYILPGLKEVAGGGESFLIRMDKFRQVGIEIDEENYTINDLFSDMKRLKEHYPDNYIISDTENGRAMLRLASKAYGVVSALEEGTGLKFDIMQAGFFFAPVSDKYREMLEQFSLAVEEGIIDKATFTNSACEERRRFLAGETFIINADADEAAEIILEQERYDYASEAEFYLMAQPGGVTGQQQYENSRLESGIVISSNIRSCSEEEQKRFLNFIDWLWYSDEGQEMTKWGIEGLTYDVVEGKKVLRDDIYYNGMNPGAALHLDRDFGFSNDNFSYGGSYDLMSSMYTDFKKEFVKRSLRLRDWSYVDPVLRTSNEEENIIEAISEDLMEYAGQMTTNFILGQWEISSSWNRYVEICKQKKYIYLEDLANNIYDRSNPGIE